MYFDRLMPTRQFKRHYACFMCLFIMVLLPAGRNLKRSNLYFMHVYFKWHSAHVQKRPPLTLNHWNAAILHRALPFDLNFFCFLKKGSNFAKSWLQASLLFLITPIDFHAYMMCFTGRHLLFNSHEWPRQNFSLQYRYNVKLTSEGNNEKIWIRGLSVDPIPNSPN